MTTHPSWRVGHQGRDGMYYEERIDGAWQRIEVQGEMLMGPAHHVIYFASSSEWQRYPTWAHARRDEIIARIKSEFRSPDYEYNGGEPSGGASADASPGASPLASARRVASAPPRANANAPRQPVQGMRALMLAVGLLLTVSAGMVWLVGSGLTKGQTYWPSKRPSQARPVVRSSEPVMYWTSIVVYATLGVGTFALAAWGVREGRRLRTIG